MRAGNDPTAASSRERHGVALVLVSAACFGALGVLSQLAYRAGVTVPGLLWGRYLLAATSVLQVFTDMAVQPYAGPETPDATTYIDEATVVEVDIKVLGSQMPPITSGP